MTAPVYLRLSRRGPAVSAWYRSPSTDQWTFIGTDYTQAFGDSVLVGQAVTSHQYGLAATATFEGGSITAPLFVESVDIGDVGAPGSASKTPGLPDLISVRGSGADIWGPLDAFHVHRSPTAVTRDFDAVVRVLSVEAVDPWTKAGLMIRSGSGAAAVHMSLFATGSNGLAFQRRVVPAASSTHTAGPALQTPVWLKLSRRGPGTVFASYREHVTDAWTLIGTDRSNAFGPDLMIGLAVTSHVKGQLATATFEHLSVVPVPQFASLDIGNVTAAGTTNSDALVTQLSSAGADIWGTRGRVPLPSRADKWRRANRRPGAGPRADRSLGEGWRDVSAVAVCRLTICIRVLLRGSGYLAPVSRCGRRYQCAGSKCSGSSPWVAARNAERQRLQRRVFARQLGVVCSWVRACADERESLPWDWQSPVTTNRRSRPRGSTRCR